MSDQNEKWDRQWGILLTRCHGEDVQADAGFKSSLLEDLKRKTVEHRESGQDAQDSDAQWSRLLKASYVPCHPQESFRNSLLGELKAKQQTVFAAPAAASGEMEAETEDVAIRTILNKSYEPVQPRKEFETRLLENLKERQRTTSVTRIRSRRRTLFLSAASSIAAAACVMFVVWVMPANSSVPARSGNLRLPVPDIAPIAAVAEPARQSARSESQFVPASFEPSSNFANADVAQAAFENIPAAFTGFRAADAFAGNPLPDHACALQNIQVNSGDGWTTLAENNEVPLSPGMTFRAVEGMGHLKFEDGSLLSITPDTLLTTTANGLMVAQGFMLAAVPAASGSRFRLHFAERDIAIEPGTDLAVMVEDPSKFAQGGAPAPMVMVVDGDDARGGLALARGRNGIAPLFTKQLYRLDNYVTADMPSRTLCDTECRDLEMFKTETIRQEGLPMASFAGGFGSDREFGHYPSNYTTVLTPAGFSRKGDKWVADSYKGEDTIKLKYLSDSYFGFVNERRDLSRAFALGGQVIVDGGDGSFYEIMK